MEGRFTTENNQTLPKLRSFIRATDTSGSIPLADRGKGKEPLRRAEDPESFPKGKERILFVDDEKALAFLGKQMLEQLGYEVIAMTSSMKALKVFLAEPDRFDLVITDMTMPDMTGLVLAHELLRIRPDIPVFLCTGFHYAITAKTIERAGIRAFAMKPLSMRKLAEIVRKVLDHKQENSPVLFLDPAL